MQLQHAGEAAFYDAGPEAAQAVSEAPSHQAPPEVVAREAAHEVAYDRIRWGRMSPLLGESQGHRRPPLSPAAAPLGEPQHRGIPGRGRSATWPEEEVHPQSGPLSLGRRRTGRPGAPMTEEEVRQPGTPLSLSGSPMGVTPRRGATSERSPLWKLRRRSKPQSWESSAEGVREQLGNFGAQLGIGPQPCKVHLKVCLCPSMVPTHLYPSSMKVHTHHCSI